MKKRSILTVVILIVMFAFTLTACVGLTGECPHNEYGEWATTTCATCENAGEKTRKCLNCDHIQTDLISALGHDFGEWTILREAQIGIAGEKQRTCLRDDCNKVDTLEIPPLPDIGNPPTDVALAMYTYLSPMRENNTAEEWSNLFYEARSSQIVDKEEAKNGGLTITEPPAGYKESYEKIDLQMSMDDLTMWGSDPLIWPGNLLKINSPASSNIFQQIVGVKRAPLTLSIGVEGSTGTGAKSTIVDSTQSATKQGISYLVNQNMMAGAQLPYMIATQMFEIKSEKEIMLALGANMRAGFGSFSASLSAELNASSGQSMTYAVILIKQIYFTINVDYPVDKGPAGFFDNSVTMENLQAAIKTGDVPAYVSSITYGRLAAITIKSNYSYAQLQAKLSLSAGGRYVSGETSAEFIDNSNDQGMDINYFIYGGSIDGNQNVMNTRNIDDMMAALNSPYDPLKNVGVPISYTVANLGDGSLARTGSMGSYYIKNYSPIKVDSISFSEGHQKALKNLCIGDYYYLQSTRLPSNAILYPVSYEIDGATVLENTTDGSSYKSVLYDKNRNKIVTLYKGEGSNGLWVLEISNETRFIGETFSITAHAGDEASNPCLIEIKIEQYWVDFIYTDTSKVRQQSSVYGKVIDPGSVAIDNKIFTGWYATSSEKAFDFERDVITQDTKLYARYSDVNNTCEVTFVGYFYDENGPINLTATYEKNSRILVDDPVREGYIFAGWYKNNSLTVPWIKDSDTTGSNDNLILYSKWAGIPPERVKIITPITKYTDLIPGEKVQLNATVEPYNASIKQATFKLADDADSSLVTLSENGLVTVNKITSFSKEKVGIVASAGDKTDVFYIALRVGWNYLFTAEDMNNIRNDLSGKYLLMDNVDLSAKYSNWTPIGQLSWTYKSAPTSWFSGIFDGNNYTVKYRITVGVKDASYGYAYGLFSLAKNATFQNIIINADIRTDGLISNADSPNNTNTGALVGVVRNSDLINCSNTTDTFIRMDFDGNKDTNYSNSNGRTGGTRVGGIAGLAQATIFKSCTNNATLYARGFYADCGGIVAVNNGSSCTFTSCTNNGNVDGSKGGWVFGGWSKGNTYASTGKFGIVF